MQLWRLASLFDRRRSCFLDSSHGRPRFRGRLLLRIPPCTRCLVNQGAGTAARVGWSKTILNCVIYTAKLIKQVEDPTSDLPEAARLGLAMLVDTLRSAVGNDSRGRAGNSNRPGRVGAFRRNLQKGSRLWPLTGADTTATLHRRKADARRNIEDGRANPAAPAYHRSERRGRSCAPARCS
jgi:hypothetical protein